MGSQLAVDTTLVSPLTRSGEPRSRGGTYAGAALQDARRSKGRTYPELLHNRRCRLVVLGIEVGGRWSNEASSFIRMLAKARARSSPPSLQAATTSALVSRWSALLTHAAATSFAASLLFEDLSPHHNLDGDLPPLGHLPSQTSPAAVEEGLDLYLPYQKHIWRLASIKTVCAWRLPSKTALYLWTFSRLKRSGREKKKKVSEAESKCFRGGVGLCPNLAQDRPITNKALRLCHVVW